MLCLADRGSLSFALWRAACATGAALVWRTPATVTLPILKPYADGFDRSELRWNQRSSDPDRDRDDEHLDAFYSPNTTARRSPRGARFKAYVAPYGFEPQDRTGDGRYNAAAVLRQRFLELQLMPLHHAADGKHRLTLAVVFQARRGYDRFDRLGLGDVDEAAGADHHHIGLAQVGYLLAAVSDEISQIPLGVYRIFITPEGDQTEFQHVVNVADAGVRKYRLSGGGTASRSCGSRHVARRVSTA